PRLRRTDRRRRDHRALYSQAGYGALRDARRAGSRRAPSRPALPPGRQPDRDGAHRPGHAGAGSRAPDPASLRQDRDHRAGLRHRDHVADSHPGRTAALEAGGQQPHRGDRAGSLRPDRHAGEPGRRAGGLSLRPGGERCARTLGLPPAGACRGYGRGLARPLAAPVAASRPAGADRDHGALAGPSPELVLLEGRAPPCPPGRRPRAHLRGMVETRCRATGGAGLFPGRGRCRRALLDLPLRRWRGCRHRLASLVPARDFRMSAPAYAELQVTSHFSFLRGASSAEELFAAAAAMGIEALAVTDRYTLAGIVRAHEAAKEAGVRQIVGCRLDLACGMSVLVYPTDRAAYSRLSRLLSLGKGRAGKARCHLEWDDLVAYGEGLIVVLAPDLADETCGLRLRRLRDAFGDRAYLGLTLRRRPNDQMRLWELSTLAAGLGVPTVVTNDVLFHEPGRRILQDVVTAIRHNLTVDALGTRRDRHADRYLKPPAEMHRLFARWPEALARTREIADRCRFSLDELRYQYPEERDDPALTPQETLERLTWEGAASRYPEGVPDEVTAALKHELALIGKLDYAPYFLTVNSIVRFARSRGILCQGRGSAANSAVCYVLGITAIDPGRNDLLFERFVS